MAAAEFTPKFCPPVRPALIIVGSVSVCQKSPRRSSPLVDASFLAGPSSISPVLQPRHLNRSSVRLSARHWSLSAAKQSVRRLPDDSSWQPAYFDVPTSSAPLRRGICGKQTAVLSVRPSVRQSTSTCRPDSTSSTRHLKVPSPELVSTA